ncbi:cyclic nucleotide-regulated ABC bacteriocin/lantibiotic exporter [Calothrix sp. NIES-4071]|nr:cyclic nucleotide-regulated ABC bacteriocin/lantibiotic exporter [Calothrix sp. NIES-4071]BAZ61763.1 cyclic nucleotide-regulated ABC bacteriocin/lantibiotic exporter [Calothrix sp. NIES-4105]
MQTQEELSLRITKVLGELAPKELQSCVQAAQILELPPLKQFWQLRDGEKGIYIVLTGKVRFLDDFENLITTLSVGASFGEATLFGEDEFSSYAARASQNLRLCYLSLETLKPLMTQYPEVKDKLYKQASIWDLILLCRQNSNFPSSPSQVPDMLEALSLFERLDVTTSETKLVLKDCNMLMIRVGRLTHSDGTLLLPGKICANPKQGNWHVEQPTTVYVLKNTDYQTALQHCYELAQFGAPSEQPVFSIRQPRKRRAAADNIENIRESIRDTAISNQKVIPFPLRNHNEQKPKKSRAYFPSPKVVIRHWWGRITRQYPFYAQQSASDCGAACLVMIGNYWGKRFSVNRLRDMTNVSRSGASLRAVAAAAESLGFASRPVKATLDKLAEQSLPAIAHWEGKHFIVVYEITSKQVIVGDPAIGQRTLTRQEFVAGWTGYALLLQPTMGLKNALEEGAEFWKFFELIKPHYKVLIEIFIASVLMQLFGLVTPIFTQLLLDRVLVQRSVATLNAVGLGMIVFGLFRIAMNGVRTYLLDHTANRVSLSLLVGFIKHTFRLPLSYFESRYVGDIVSRVQENQKIQRFLTGQTLSIVLDMLTLVVYLGLMLSYSWRMTLFVLLTVPPFFILALASTSILRRISRDVFNANAEENSYLIQSLTGIRTVRSLAIEQTVRWRWEELLNHLIKKGFNAQVIGNRLSVISGAIETFTSTGLMWYGATQVINGELTIGQLVAFNMLVGNVLSPFQRLSLLWNELQEIVISTERINDVLEAEPEEDLLSKPRKTLGVLKGRIRFQNVTFRYHPESPKNVLENINFEIKPEQMVALVGRSGSGKTTLSKLILGLYPPTDGKVLIDGHDVTSISLRSLRSQVGVVDQDTFLFGGTIRENISIAYPNASFEEIIQAAQLAGADEFIQQLPLGYETQIGEGGGMLSGGQRQRIAIARALMGNPRLLLFDEATSHLDTESERIIQNNLKTILKGRTSVIIAHRLSTVRSADLILVLDHGVLVESGTHDELIAKQGHYYYLNQQQLAQAG